MANAIVAVEDGLTPVMQELQERGYEVRPLDNGSMGEAEVVVVTGGDDNLMGIEDIETEAPVIVAEGLTANDVCDRVEKELKRRKA